MYPNMPTGPLWPIGKRAFHTALIAGGLIAAIFVLFFAWPAFSAEPITDQESCRTALTAAEDAIVRANIDSDTFRLLNDQLVETRALCDQDNYTAAEPKLAGVMNTLKDTAKK